MKIIPDSQNSQSYYLDKLNRTIALNLLISFTHVNYFYGQ